MLPDKDLGVFIATNGFDYTKDGRILLSVFIMDLILGEKPWLNTTTVCTFPEPWHPNPWFPSQKKGATPNEKKVFSTPDPPTSIPYPTDLTPYVGVYGDFFYGNMTVYSTDSQTLMLSYGTLDPWRLVPTEGENAFIGYASPATWPQHLDFVKFKFSKEGLPKFDLCEAAFDPIVATTFQRDLKMADAPPPPDPNECN